MRHPELATVRVQRRQHRAAEQVRAPGASFSISLTTAGAASSRGAARRDRRARGHRARGSRVASRSSGGSSSSAGASSASAGAARPRRSAGAVDQRRRAERRGRAASRAARQRGQRPVQRLAPVDLERRQRPVGAPASGPRRRSRRATASTVSDRRRRSRGQLAPARALQRARSRPELAGQLRRAAQRALRGLDRLAAERLRADLDAARAGSRGRARAAPAAPRRARRRHACLARSIVSPSSSTGALGLPGCRSTKAEPSNRVCGRSSTWASAWTTIVLLDLELDHDVVAHPLDLADLAHVDPRDADVAVDRAETVDVVELGPDRLAVANGFGFVARREHGPSATQETAITAIPIRRCAPPEAACSASRGSASVRECSSVLARARG